MFVLIWNCRGARCLDFSVAVKDLVVVHNPAIMIIIETRVRAGNVSLIMNKFPLTFGLIRTRWFSRGVFGFYGVQTWGPLGK